MLASFPKGLAEYNAGMVETQGASAGAGPNVANNAGPLTFGSLFGPVQLLTADFEPSGNCVCPKSL